MHRLDRAAGEINPILIVLVIGLLILTVARLVTLGLSDLPSTRGDPSCPTSPASAVSSTSAVGRPG